MQCAFCTRSAIGKIALTSYDERREHAWVRSIDPVCTRCDAMIGVAGSPGRRHKRTGVTWYGGHTGDSRRRRGYRETEEAKGVPTEARLRWSRLWPRSPPLACP